MSAEYGNGTYRTLRNFMILNNLQTGSYFKIIGAFILRHPR
jgi:hypothetical protein